MMHIPLIEGGERAKAPCVEMRFPTGVSSVAPKVTVYLHGSPPSSRCCKHQPLGFSKDFKMETRLQRKKAGRSQQK